MAKEKESKTPMLDELETGPWPSFIKDLKNLAKRKPEVQAVLEQLEDSYESKTNHWLGTVLNLDGYGGGVIARYSDVQSKFALAAQFHTIRIIEPSG